MSEAAPPPQQERQPAAPAAPPQKTPEEIAAERAAQHAAFVSRYINPRTRRDPAVQTIALAIVSENANFNQATATAVAGRCKPERLTFLSDLFTLQFVSDGFFNDAFNGSAKVFHDLDLANYADMLLLGRQTVEYFEER